MYQDIIISKKCFCQEREIRSTEKNVWFELHTIVHESFIEVERYPINSVQLQNT